MGAPERGTAGRGGAGAAVGQADDLRLFDDRRAEVWEDLPRMLRKALRSEGCWSGEAFAPYVGPPTSAGPRRHGAVAAPASTM